RLAGQSPAGLGVDRTRERVGDRVEVGADVESVEHEVVADVDDGRHLLGRYDVEQPLQEPGSPDPAGEDRDQKVGRSSPLSSARSASTIMRTRSANATAGFQPNTRRAFDEFPTSRSTSAGRKKRSSCTT